MGAKRRIFISYSHKDGEWLERLKTFLRPFEREADLEVWSDADIQPSFLWESKIQKAINEADAAILLVSQDFLASDFIADNELPQLLKAASERGLRIFPLIVSTGFFKNSPLLRFQAVNAIESPLDTLDRSAQNVIFAKLAESIDDLLKVSLEGVTEEWLDRFRGRFELVEAGNFTAGDNELYNKMHALREHEVKVESFRLGRYVVTQSEWTAIMKTQPWLNQGNVMYGDDIPAIYLSWYDAIDFVRVINKIDSKYAYRLPTESEWEYAARGGQTSLTIPRTKFCFGNNQDQLIHYGWYDKNASLRGNNYAHGVGMLKPNQLNLFDMHGNIWEWTSDDIDGLRALRGGGFNFVAEGASSAFRVVQKAEAKGEATGFRLVQEAK